MKNRLINLIITALFLGLVACGGEGAGSGTDAPAEAVIITSVPDISWTIADTIGYDCSFVDSFIIEVKDKATNVPLRNVRLTIFNSLADPNFPGYIRLFDGDPNDGGHRESSPMTVTTDKNGTFTLFFKYCAGGVEYSSPFTISSGPITEIVTFSVSGESETPTP